MTLAATFYRFDTPTGVHEVRATDEAHAWRRLRITTGHSPDDSRLFAQEPVPRATY